MRHCRPAQCRQIDPVQCADPDCGGAGGELSVLHHRAQCRRCGGARCASGPPRENRQIGAGDSHPYHLCGHCRAGARRLQGRRAGQPVPRQYPRSGCGGPCGALFRGRRCHPCGRAHRRNRRCRDGRDRIDAGRSGEFGKAHRADRKAGQDRREGGGVSIYADEQGADPAARRQAGAPSRVDGRRTRTLSPPRAIADRKARALCLQCG